MQTSTSGTGLSLGRYTVDDLVSADAAGAMWHGTDRETGRGVLVHELRGGGPDVVRRAEPARAVRGETVVSLLDVVQVDDRVFVVLDAVPGETLSDHLRSTGPVSARAVAAVGLDILDALDAAAAVGISHGDLRPGNVLLREDDRAVVMGFGLAAAQAPGATGVVGAPAYLAPERLRGSAPDAASDLWSLGVLLFTMIEGRPPFPTDDTGETATAVATGAPATPRRAPQRLCALVEALLSKEPSERPTSAEVRTELTALLKQRPRTSRRRVLAAAAVLILAAAGGGWLLMRSHDLPLPPAAAAVAGQAPAGPHGGAAVSGQSSSAPAATVPAGWVTVRGPDWTIAQPRSWHVRGTGDDLRLASASGLTTVSIRDTATSAPPTADHLTDVARDVAASHPGYHRLGSRTTTLHGEPALVWDYTFTSGGSTMRASDLAIVVGGRAYVLHLESSASWTYAEPLLAGFRMSFQPAAG